MKPKAQAERKVVHLLDTDAPPATLCGLPEGLAINNLLYRHHRADALASLQRIDEWGVWCPSCIIADVERRVGLIDSFGTCGAGTVDPAGGLFEEVYCTLPRRHDGKEHIATIGPYSPTAPVLARWLNNSTVAGSTPSTTSTDGATTSGPASPPA